MEEMVTTFNASPAARELTLRAVHTSGVLADSKDMTDICNGRYDLVFTSSEVYTNSSHPLRKNLSRLNVVLTAIDGAHLVEQWGLGKSKRVALRGSFSKLGSSRAEFTNRTPPMTLLSAS
jgi:superfamily II DNA helicase RecQ